MAPSQDQSLNMAGDNDDRYGSECLNQNEYYDEAQNQGQDELEAQDEDAEDVIDIDDPVALAKRGLQRVHDQDNNMEYLLDQEGNLFNLQGEFMGKCPVDDVEPEDDDVPQQY